VIELVELVFCEKRAAIEGFTAIAAWYEKKAFCLKKPCQYGFNISKLSDSALGFDATTKGEGAGLPQEGQDRRSKRRGTQFQVALFQ